MLTFSKRQGAIVGLAALALVAALAVEQAAALEPLVDTRESDLSPNGRHVSVHVPAVFDLKLDTRGPHGEGFRLRQNVLSGLVSLNIDRARNSEGRLYGPIQVRVMGVTMYDNKAKPISPSSPASYLTSDASTNQESY